MRKFSSNRIISRQLNDNYATLEAVIATARLQQHRRDYMSGSSSNNRYKLPGSSSSSSTSVAGASATSSSASYGSRDTTGHGLRREHTTHRRLDVPWFHLPGDAAVPYIEEAEAQYGRKEVWHLYKDPELRRTLLGLLARYCMELRDQAVKARTREATLSRVVQAEGVAFSQWVHTVAEDPSAMPRSSSPVTRNKGKLTEAAAAALAKAEEEDSKQLQQGGSSNNNRRNNNVGDGSGGELWKRRMGGGGAEDRPNSYEELPFLRQRMMEEPDSLDDELKGWLDENMNEQQQSQNQQQQNQQQSNPKQQQQQQHVHEEPQEPLLQGAGAGAGVGAGVAAVAKPVGAGGGRKAMPPLSASLRATLRSMHRNFDAEGVFFERLPPLREGKPAISGAGKSAHHRGPSRNTAGLGQVKVDWATVRAAYGGSATPEESFRARERILRISRGENPETI